MDKSGQIYEFEGMDVEDAINNALKSLKTSRSKITIKIVSEEKMGLFGMSGEKPAKIKVSLKEIKKKS